jgi:ribosomal peptide maturation radical SAM protein 1
MPETNQRVALVYMPFGLAAYPALGISLLKAELARHGIASDVHYFNLRLAAQLGIRNYSLIAGRVDPATLLGEWLFSAALFGENPIGDGRYVEEVLWREMGAYIGPADVLELLRVREQLPEFIHSCYAAVEWAQYGVVGLSSCYQQTCASLALAQTIKAHHPEIKIVLGGGNCAGEMGSALCRLFPYVDFVCVGEGEIAFPKLVQALADGADTSAVDGIASRTSRESSASVAPSYVADMDALAYPDYTDYLTQFGDQFDGDLPEGKFPLETTRGCWWAARRPCAFCSLSAPGLPLRSKSPPRVIAEIAHLTANYGTRIWVADLALNPSYQETTLPSLAARASPASLYWEARADLRREHVAQMARAGITVAQLGVESLSDALLGLMGKGTTRLQNIQALKWCKQFGIMSPWFLLYGFPGEDPGEYAALETLMPLICHLPAPQELGHIRFERFSRYVRQPAEHGITRVAPRRAYHYVYPHLSADDLAQIAFYFDADYPDVSGAYVQSIARVVKEWQSRAGAVLDVFPSPGSIRIVDTRRPGAGRDLHFAGLAAELYLRCDAGQTARALMNSTAVRGRASQAEAVAMLEQFVEQGLMIRTGKRYLSLAVLRDG